jgi:hypothetical protein
VFAIEQLPLPQVEELAVWLEAHRVAALNNATVAAEAWCGHAVPRVQARQRPKSWLSRAFVKYRRGGGTKNSPLPDFSIGAQAEAEGLTLVTRDTVRYRHYFPTVKLITP